MLNFESTITGAPEIEAATLRPGNGSTQNKPLTDVRGSGTAALWSAHSTGSGPASSRLKRKGSALTVYIPLWQQISGLRTDTMDELDYEQRLIGLRKLMNEFERMLRQELNIPAQGGVYPLSALVKKSAPCVAPITHKDGNDSNDNKEGEQSPSLGSGQESNSQQPIANSQSANSHFAERTFFWDPLPKICLMLGISRSALSRLSKEFSDMSAHEVMDRIRAETVKDKMRQDIRLHGLKVFSYALTTGKGKGPFNRNKTWPFTQFRFVYYESLKRSRVEPAFDRTTWAISFGFPNYARFRRACLLRFGMTPQQIELEIIGESETILAEETAIWAKRYEGDPDPEPWPVGDTPEWMAWNERRGVILAAREAARRKKLE